MTRRPNRKWKRSLVRELRRTATKAERLAWQVLRNRQVCGLKFRRQHPVAGMVVDFYCPELRLALELDGGHHATPQQRARDLARTAMLNARGIRVVRVPNADVTTAHLVALIQSLSPPLRIGGEGAGG